MLKPITAEACERLFERLLDLGDGGGAERGPIVTTTEAPHFRRVVLERARRDGLGEAAVMRERRIRSRSTATPISSERCAAMSS